MLIRGWLRSIRVRLPSVPEGSFPFQPVQLYLELADFLVQDCLQFRFFLFLVLPLAGEDLLDPVLQLTLPVADLGRMDPIFAGQLVDRLLPFEGFQGDPGFELGAMLLSFHLF